MGNFQQSRLAMTPKEVEDILGMDYEVAKGYYGDKALALD